MKPMSLMNPATCKLVLLLSGLVASGIAGMILFVPHTFYAAYGIELAGNTDLTNELKAPAGALFVAGLLMIAGVFRTQLTFVSLATATAMAMLMQGKSTLRCSTRAEKYSRTYPSPPLPRSPSPNP